MTLMEHFVVVKVARRTSACCGIRKFAAAGLVIGHDVGRTAVPE